MGKRSFSVILGKRRCAETPEGELGAGSSGGRLLLTAEWRQSGKRMEIPCKLRLLLAQG